MSFSTVVQAAVDRLRTYYNGQSFGPANPGGMDNGGHQVNFEPCLRDIATVGAGIAERAAVVEQVGGQAAERADGAWDARNQSIAARDAAAGSATAAAGSAAAAAQVLQTIQGGPVASVQGRKGVVTLDSRDLPDHTLVTAVPVTAVAGQTVIVTAAVAVSLPLNPVSGATVTIVRRSVLAPTVARNGSQIQGRDEDLLLDLPQACVVLRYTDLANGWQVLTA